MKHTKGGKTSMKHIISILILAAFLFGCPNPNPNPGTLQLNTKIDTLAAGKIAAPIPQGESPSTRNWDPSYGEIQDWRATSMAVTVYDYQAADDIITIPVSTEQHGVIVSNINGQLPYTVPDLVFDPAFLNANDRADIDILEFRIRGSEITFTIAGGYGNDSLNISGVKFKNKDVIAVLFVRKDWCSTSMKKVLTIEPNGSITDPLNSDAVLSGDEYSFLQKSYIPKSSASVVGGITAFIVPLDKLYRLAWKDTSIDDTSIPADSFTDHSLDATGAAILTTPSVIIKLDLSSSLIEVPNPGQVTYYGDTVPLNITSTIDNNGNPIQL
jgi:hypothetical protein